MSLVILGLWVGIGVCAEVSKITVQDLRRQLQDGKSKDALRIYDQLYPSREGKQDPKSLNLICRGLLKEAVKSENPYDRIYAAGALVEQGDFSFLAFLEKSRLSKNPMERVSAYQELVEVSRQLGRQSAIVPLFEQALSDQDKVVLVQMLEMLEQMDDKDPSLLPLLENLLGNQDVQVRNKVVEVLGEMAPSSAITSLEKSLKDGNHYVRLAAMSSLVLKGKTAYLQELVQDATENKDAGIRDRAVGLLGRVDHKSVPPLLRKKFKEEKDFSTKITIAASLGELGDKTGVNFLEESLQNPSFLVRLGTVKALGRAHQPFFLPLLEHAFQDEDPAIRTFALLFIGEARDDSLLPLIDQALEDKDPAVRMSSAQILGELGGPAQFSSLREALHDEDPGVVIFASRAIGRILIR